MSRLLPPLSRDKSHMLMLLAACLLVLLPHLLHVSGAIAGSVLVLMGWRGWIVFTGRRLPPRWMLVPVAVAAMAGIWLSFHTFFGRDAGVAMLTFLLVLKLLEMHARRDMFVVLYLSFFLLLTSFFYSQTIGTALLMCCALVALLTAHIGFQYAGVVPSFKRRVRLPLTIVGLAMPLMLVLFFLFPRIQGPLWGLPGDANSGRSGLSDSMSPGTISDLALSDDIAFRAQFLDPVPAQAQLYWRAAVLGHYDGRNWTRHAERLLPTNAITITLLAPSTRYVVTMEPTGRRWLYTLDVPFLLPAVPGQRVYRSNTYELLTLQPISERLRYGVDSSATAKLQLNAEPNDIDDALQRPVGFDPATTEFAHQLLQKSSDASALVNLVLQYFRREPFRYTLEPPLLGSNSVDDFLFNTRAGFCEHYAGAFVFLMRELGIPARVVTGYQGGAVNPVDGYLEVRQSDAHAWAEVWLEKRGWVRVDPTAAVAPERVERKVGLRAPRGLLGGLIGLTPSQGAWLPILRLNLDAIANSWNQWVLGYSPTRQKNLISSLGFGDVDWTMLTALMFGCGSAVMALTMMPLVLRRTPMAPIDRIYWRFCQRIARHGVVRAIDEGPRALRDRVVRDSSLAPAKKIAAIRFLERYEALQYGTVISPAGNSALTQLKALLAACR